MQLSLQSYLVSLLSISSLISFLGDSFVVSLPSGPATVILSNITAPKLGKYKVENMPGSYYYFSISSFSV